MNLIIALLFTSPFAHANTATINDARISTIVMEANNADIENSKLAKMKTQNVEVKNYAAEMIEDHSAANRELQQVVEKANIDTKQSAKSKDIKVTKKDTKSNLKTLSGAEFDKAYAESEVAMHTQVLNTIDQELLPNVKSPNLRDYLTKTRATIAGHLDHAKSLQSKLNM